MRKFINYLKNLGITPTEFSKLNDLNNVDNTSDVNKPVSTAQATAIGLKIPKSTTNMLFVPGDGTAAENYTALTTAYALAKTMTPFGNPLSSTNRVTIVIAPGRYGVTDVLPVNTQYIDFVSLSGSPDVFISGISVTANDVFLKGLEVFNSAFAIATNLNLLKCENCVGNITNSFCVVPSGNVTGTFINCVGGQNAFSGISANTSGTFIDCVGGDQSFGGQFVANGIFKNCTGGWRSFGGNGGGASGTFTNCIGGNDSFGGEMGWADGTFTNCTGGTGSFGTEGAASGTFINCIGGLNSFGNGSGSELTGKLYWCRLTSGTFQTPSGAGEIHMCLDGTNTFINSLSIAKSVVGLGNVDNTSDANKPVSTAQSTAIGLRIPKQAAQTLYVAGEGTVAQNYAELAAAYALAKTMTPYGNALSTTNRVTIVIAPGLYNNGSALLIDTQFIDFVSLTGKSDVILSGITVSVSDVLLRGINVGTADFVLANGLPLLKCEYCTGGAGSFGTGVTASGTFLNCIADSDSFGGSMGGEALGTFIDCVAGTNSFGGGGGYASGTFINCTGGNGCFAGGGGFASGTFYNCVAGADAFGSGGEASGTFTNCTAGSQSFGYGMGGSLTGKLYWCKLTTGTFKTVSGTGQTRLCLDGTNVENNQG